MSTSGTAGLASCFMTAIATSWVSPSANTGETALGLPSCPRSPCRARCWLIVGAVTTPMFAEQPTSAAAAAHAGTTAFQLVMCGASPSVGDDAERLGVRQTKRSPGVTQPLADERVDVAVADLALVTVQGGHLVVERLGDIDRGGLDGRSHQPGLLTFSPRLQPLFQQLGEDRRGGATGHRDVEGGLADHAMVRVVDESVGRERIWA